jgi:hypothetical protein
MLNIVEVEFVNDMERKNEPHRLIFANRTVQILEIIDRWLSPDQYHYKVKAEDGCVYMLCHDLNTQLWEVTMFERRDELQTDEPDHLFQHRFRGQV